MRKNVRLAVLVGRVEQHRRPGPARRGDDGAVLRDCLRAVPVVVRDVNLARRARVHLERDLGFGDAGLLRYRFGDDISQRMNLAALRATSEGFSEHFIAVHAFDNARANAWTGRSIYKVFRLVRRNVGETHEQQIEFQNAFNLGRKARDGNPDWRIKPERIPLSRKLQFFSRETCAGQP